MARAVISTQNDAQPTNRCTTLTHRPAPASKFSTLTACSPCPLARGRGWFWWLCKPGSLPEVPPTGPFATSYGAYRDALDRGNDCSENASLSERICLLSWLPNDTAAARASTSRKPIERRECSGRETVGHRDATMVLVAYRHGLRASELVDLRMGSGGVGTAASRPQGQAGRKPSTHPIAGDELRALRRLQRGRRRNHPSCSWERGAPFTTAGFVRVVERQALPTLKAPAHAAATLRL